MQENLVFLGIDTSNYTTSAALCTADGRVLLNHKVPLPVKEGERGLRQSDAVFHHVKNLPESASAIGEYLRANPQLSIAAVAVSKTPRDVPGSYMPCFLSGVATAEFISVTNGVPIYYVSHQAGHVMAALSSACEIASEPMEKIASDRFIAFHVSGGTTDVLLCEPDEERIFKITQIGGTRDINAGQAIDRSGVMMGLRFPCGAEMDKMALSYDGRINKFALSVDGTWCNLSGLENRAKKMQGDGLSHDEISANVFDFIARTLEKITKNAISEHGEMPVIYAGGVMSSQFIKKTLSKYGMFASPAHSADNAVGVALHAAEYYKRSNG